MAGVYDRWMSTTYSYMVISPKQFLWFNHLGSKIHQNQIMCVASRKPFMVSNKLPKAWFTALKVVITHLHFLQSKVDPSLFIYLTDSLKCYLLVYIDDLVITGNNPVFIADVIRHLSTQFHIKNLGDLHFFLGIEVIPTYVGLFLIQHKYIHELLL